MVIMLSFRVNRVRPGGGMGGTERDISESGPSIHIGPTGHNT